MSVRTAQLSQAYPDTNKDLDIEITSALDGNPSGRIKGERKPAALLLAIVLVMLLPCINVASLLLNRAVARMDELTIRAALGATRMRIARQLLTESLVLNLLGGCIGILLFFWASHAIALLSLPGDIAINLDIKVKVIGYSVGLCIAISTIFGLLPIIHAARFDLASRLRSQGMSKSYGVRAVLICVEMAISLAIMILASTTIKYQDKYVQPELQVGNIMLASFEPRLYNYTEDKESQVKSEIISRIKSIPGVRNVGFASTHPYSSFTSSTDITEIDGSGTTSKYHVVTNYIGQDYFSTLNIPIIRGRDMSYNTESEVVISKSMAEKFWQNQDVLGKQILLDMGLRAYSTKTIVGVAGNSALSGSSADTPIMYSPLTKLNERSTTTLIVSSMNNDGKMKSAIIQEIRAVDEQLIVDIRSLKEQFDIYRKPQKIILAITFLVGIIVFAIAATGIYTIANDAVSHRMREIGIRMMVGATPSDIVKLFIKSGIKIVIFGIALGTFIAWVISRKVFSVADVLGVHNYIFVSLILGAIMIAAWYSPIRKAIKSEPINLVKK